MLSFATKHNDPEKSLGWQERIGYGVGGFGFNSINGIIGSFLMLYFTNVALLDSGIISTIIAVSKLFDGVSDLVVGRLVDNTQSKFGKARVWLLRMCVPFAITVLLLFFVPQNFPTLLKYVYVFLMYNIVNAVCLTSLLVPFFSMTSLISKNAYERGFLGNVQQIFQTLGNVVVNSTFVLLLTKFAGNAENIYTQKSFTLTMMVFCIAMIITTLITVIFTKERVVDTDAGEQAREVEDKGEKVNLGASIKALFTNKYWVILTVAMFVIFFTIIFSAVGAVYYAQYVFKDMSTYAWLSNSTSIAQFAIMFTVPVLLKKFPKHQVYTFGIGIMAVGYLGFGLTSDMGNTLLMIIFNVMKASCIL